MAVYTEVAQTEAQEFIKSLNLGEISNLHGITAGIENTNYFVTTERGEYVLTLFERLSFEQLPYYLYLMQHLAKGGLSVPSPQPNAKGEILHRLAGKPCAVVNRLKGASDLSPSLEHCKTVGTKLARMHLIGQNFEMQQGNLRGLAWWNETVPVVLPYLNVEQSKLIQNELAAQNQLAQNSLYAKLPQGPIHADLFRDNVLFSRSDKDEQVCAFFDFYFAANDTWLFDICVCLNDWCIDHATGKPNPEKEQAFLAGYESVRPLTAEEKALMPAVLRGAALRFWISRLWDFYLPRAASQLKAHDPTHFERVLLARQDSR